MGATGEQVQVCLRQRNHNGVFGLNFGSEDRHAIRLRFRTCVQQAVALNNGHASSRSTSRASFSSSSPTPCTPKWKCAWGACTNGWQSQTPVDVSNCGRATGTIACTALARQCTPSTRCTADTDCPQIACFAAPCPTKTCVNGTCVNSTTSAFVTEQVKCVFSGATTEQRCDTATASDSPLAFGCSGIGTCVAGVKGPRGTALTWKSSCGGYAYTTLDGNSEYANFSCGVTSSSANTSLHANQSSVSLGAASTFGVLAGSTVTNTGPTTVTGNLGVSPGSAVTGFAPGIVNGGAIHVTDTLASQAKVALTIAYNDLAGRSTNPVSVAGNLGGSTLSPGLYKSTSSLEISSGDLTLDAKGNANAVFVFQVASTLSVSAGRQIVLIGGAKAANIFWQVGTSANLGTNATFKGTILADQSISLQTGAKVDGRLLARIGAVTLQSNTVTVPAN